MARSPANFFGVLLLVLSPLAAADCAKDPHPVVDPAVYYIPITATGGSELARQLNTLVRGHRRYSYTPCVWEILTDADRSPDQLGRPVSEVTSVRTLYRREDILVDDRDRGQNDPDSWNREHVWAKSHGFPQKGDHAYTDAHHIRAADRSVNSDRSDHDFDDGGMPDTECSDCLEGNGTWFPGDRSKGDVARMLFYMDVRYDGNDGSGTPGLRLVDRANTARSDEYGELGKLCTLIRWHLDDPVSSEERRRNDVIQSWQGNRNPFIDRPHFAQAIWGSQCGVAPFAPEGASEVTVAAWNVAANANATSPSIEANIAKGIALLASDILILSEVESAASLGRIAQLSSVESGRSYAAHFCPESENLNLAILYDTRIDVSPAVQVPGTDLSNERHRRACASYISTETFDFVLIGVHLKSGGGSRAVRVDQANAIASFIRGATLREEKDVVLVGDFNMFPERDAGAFDALAPSRFLRFLSNEALCDDNGRNCAGTHLNSGGYGNMLDGYAISRAVDEYREDSFTRVLLHEDMGFDLQTFRRNVSDHLPLRATFLAAADDD